ncbi:MAG: thiamine phosphate synthase [Parvibaculaceae bacterium]|nr:thiamine phosphate synthase [Parvibaculaceae bacterium]
MLHLPRRFYFTDERTLTLSKGAADERRVETLLNALPEDTGIILRHYSLPQQQRKRLGTIIKNTGRLLIVAGDPQLARCLNADGIHLPQWQSQSLARANARLSHQPNHWIISAAVHDLGAGHAANQIMANLIFTSPVLATQSHPGAPNLGVLKLAQLVSRAHQPVYALGGMNEQAFKRLRHTGIAGYGGIQFGTPQ